MCTETTSRRVPDTAKLASAIGCKPETPLEPFQEGVIGWMRGKAA